MDVRDDRAGRCTPFGNKSLPQRTVFGARPYGELPAYGRAFDVAIIPYHLTQQVLHANPLKLREYLAMGKPIVAVRTPEIAQFADVVRIADTREEFLAHLDSVLTNPDSPAEIERRLDRVAESSWETRIRSVLRAWKNFTLPTEQPCLPHQADRHLPAHRVCMSEPTKKFRSAIIGAGLICPFHIAGIRRSGLAEVVALCDINLPQARQIAEKHGIPQVVERVAELQELDLDVIHIATPPHSHFSLTMQALEMGWHVFVEKPLATDIAQCDLIRQRAAEANRQVCTNHSNLLDPFIARAIRLAREGRIGEVHSVTHLRSSGYPPYRGGPLPPHYREGGFPFRDIGVHALYITQALLGKY